MPTLRRNICMETLNLYVSMQHARSKEHFAEKKSSPSADRLCRMHFQLVSRSLCNDAICGYMLHLPNSCLGVTEIFVFAVFDRTVDLFHNLFSQGSSGLAIGLPFVY